MKQLVKIAFAIVIMVKIVWALPTLTEVNMPWFKKAVNQPLCLLERNGDCVFIYPMKNLPAVLKYAKWYDISQSGIVLLFKMEELGVREGANQYLKATTERTPQNRAAYEALGLMKAANAVTQEDFRKYNFTAPLYKNMLANLGAYDIKAANIFLTYMGGYVGCINGSIKLFEKLMRENNLNPNVCSQLYASKPIQKLTTGAYRTFKEMGTFFKYGGL